MVAEADESDRSFLKLSPSIAVITNIDREHLEAYGSFDALVDAFADFAGRVPFYGAVIACIDDAPGGGDAAHGSSGASSPTDFPRAPTSAAYRRSPTRAAAAVACAMRFAACLAARERANCSSACRACTTCRTRSPPSRSAWSSACRSSELRAALAEFNGAERRYEVRGAARRASPSWTTTATTRPRSPRCCAPPGPASPAGSSRCFSRIATRARATCCADFGPALALADVVVLTDIYPAGEAPIAGATLDRRWRPRSADRCPTCTSCRRSIDMPQRCRGSGTRRRPGR